MVEREDGSVETTIEVPARHSKMREAAVTEKNEIDEQEKLERKLIEIPVLHFYTSGSQQFKHFKLHSFFVLR